MKPKAWDYDNPWENDENSLEPDDGQLQDIAYEEARQEELDNTNS